VSHKESRPRLTTTFDGDHDTVTPKAPTGLTIDQLEERRTGLGGTDAAAVLGVSPWVSPLDVYNEKVHGITTETTDPEQLARMAWGLTVEPALHARYREVSGRTRLRRVSAHSRTMRHPKLPWVIGHPDALDSEVVVDYKWNERAQGWGEPGTDEVPPHYKLQIWHYMLLTGRRLGVLYASVGGRPPAEWLVPWVPEIPLLGEEEGDWWREHVLAGVPPDPTGAEADAHALRRMYPAPVPGSVKVAMPYQHPIIAELVHAKAEAKRWSHEQERLEQVIQAAMGEAQELHAPGVKFTWKVEAGRVSWKQYAESLEKLVGLMATGENIQMDPLEEVNTLKGLYTGEGKRTFRTYVSKGPLLVIQGGADDAEQE
jgi:putative phage-type endonuclease